MKRKIFDLFRLFWKLPLMERMLVQLTTGMEYGSVVTKFVPNHYQYPKNSIRQIKRKGICYNLDLSDTVDWFIYFGFTENTRLKLYELAAPGNIVIDVGANVGDVSLHMAKLIGDNGMVYAFEPDPINFQRLKVNLSLNSQKNIEASPRGLGETPGSYKIYTIDEKNKGMNRILGEQPGTSEGREIEITTLDEWVKTKQITRIDLIKIDVEGFEFKVLKGAENSLKEFRPKLFIELDDENLREQGSSARELVKFLNNLGYKMKSASSNEVISETSDFLKCHYDLIAIYESKTDLI